MARSEFSQIKGFLSSQEVRMDGGFWFSFMPMIIVPFALANFAWYVAVIVFLYKIWKKVKHLPE